MRKKILAVFALVLLLSSCTTLGNESQTVANDKRLTEQTYTTSVSENKTPSAEQEKNCISPYEVIEKIKAVEMKDRYTVLHKIIKDNGFDKYFEGIYINEESKNNILVPVVYEYNLGEKDVVLMLMKKGRHEYDYLLFVKESGSWSMNCVVSVSERNSPYFSLEYTPDKEDFWLVYREEVGHGTGESRFNDIWVNRYGEEVLRYPAQVYAMWETAENTFLNVNYHTERSHSLQDLTIDEYADYYDIPPYSITLTGYTNFDLGSYYGAECFRQTDTLVYYWDKEEEKFVIDFENKSKGDYQTSFSPTDAMEKDVCGENYFDFANKYHELFEEVKAKVNTEILNTEEHHQNIVKAFREALPRP